MPTYVYQCNDCGYNFEQVQKITEDSLKDCPSCNKPALRRLMTAPAFHLKGSGWYKTDYASSSNSSNSGSFNNSSTTKPSTSEPSTTNSTASSPTTTSPTNTETKLT